MDYQLGIVAAQYNEPVTEPMLEMAMEAAEEHGVEIAEVVEVPGVYDSPLAADRLARREEIDAVVVIGAVVTGDTDHDQVIGHAVGPKLSEISLRRDTPVTFGVSGPGMSGPEARERVEKGAGALNAAVDLMQSLP